jgi:hypothetical protein
VAPLEDGSSGIEDDNAGARVVNGRLQIAGHVVVAPSTPPAGSTPVTIAADTPLDVNGTDDTAYTITNGKTFYLQQLIAGAEDSPVAAGSAVEVFFDDGAEHIVSRIYVAGFTNIVSYPDIDEARDGTTMTGNGTNQIIVRRRRLSNQTLEIEGVVLGYEV